MCDFSPTTKSPCGDLRRVIFAFKAEIPIKNRLDFYAPIMQASNEPLAKKNIRKIRGM